MHSATSATGTLGVIMGLNLVNFVFGSFDHFLSHHAQHFPARLGRPSSLRHILADSSLHIEGYSGFFGFRVKKLFMSWLAGELCYGTSSIIGCEIGQAWALYTCGMLHKGGFTLQSTWQCLAGIPLLHHVVKTLTQASIGMVRAKHFLTTEMAK